MRQGMWATQCHTPAMTGDCWNPTHLLFFWGLWKPLALPDYMCITMYVKKTHVHNVFIFTCNIWIHVHTYLHTYVRTYIQTYRHTGIQTDIHTIHTIHTHRHTDIQTYRQTYRHTDIRTDIQTYGQTYRLTDRQTDIHTYPSGADVRPKFHWGFSWVVVCSGYVSDCFRVCLGLVPHRNASILGRIHDNR